MSGNLTNPVLSLEIDDSGLTPGARAAADALNKLGDAAVTVETRLGKVSATASSLVNSNNAATKAANSLAAAQEKLATSTVTLDRALAAGDITQTEYAGTITGLQAKVQKASDTVAAASAGHTQLAAAVHGTSLTLGQVAPQFVQLFSSIQTGQPIITSLIQQGHQLGDQMLVTGTSVGQLAGVIGGGLKTALGAILSPIGLAVSGAALLVGGIYAVTSAAESSQSRLVALQQQLRGTRDDYTAMAAEATAAAKAVAAATTISTADARTGAQILVANPNFTGTQAQLQTLIVLGANLAKVMSTDIPTGEKLLASAMDDAGKVAQSLADQHIAGVSAALVDQVKAMTNAGQNSQAFGVLMDALKGRFDGADAAATPLEKALHDLDQSFTSAGASGTSFAEKLGAPINSAVANVIEQIAKMVKALNDAPSGLTNAANIFLGLVNPTPGSFISAVGGAALQGSGGGWFSGSGSTPTGALPRGIRNNNPLNLSYTGTGNGAVGQDGQFAIFPDMQTGIAANQGQLLRYQDVYGLNTIAGIVNRWAPPGTNNTAAYAAQVAKALGTTVDMPINLHDAGTMQAITQAMSNVENGPGFNLNTIGSSPIGNGTASNPLVLPPVQITAASPTGVVNGNPLLDPAVIAAQKASLAGQVSANGQQQTLLQSAIGAATQSGDTAAVTQLTQALADAKGKATDLITAQQLIARSAQDAVAPLQAQTGAQRDLATVYQQFVDAARKAGTDVDQTALAAAQSAKLRQLAQDYADTTGEASRSADAQLAINAAYDGSQASLDHATNAQKALTKAQADYTDTSSPAAQAAISKYTDQLNRGSDATRALADEQANLQAGAAAFSSAFDTIGNAVTQSFLSGTGAAVNWGNTLSAVLQQVLQQAAKLAILNPILNSLFNQNNPTLGGVLSAVGSVSSANTAASAVSGASSSGGLTNLQNLFQLGSTANTVAGSPISLSSIGGHLGLGGITDYASNLLATPLFGGVSASATNTALAGLGSGVYGPETAAAYSAAGGAVPTTLGGALGIAGGIGAGYGVGSLAGGYVQSALGKVGPAPQIGAAAGALAGAAGVVLAPETFGLSIPIAALLGGAIGGVGGGLIGPHAASEFSSIGLSTTPGGLLTTGTPLVQGDSNAAQEAQAAAAQASALNNLLIQSGISISSLGGIREIGTNDRALTPTEALSKTADINSAFPKFGFSVNDTSTDEGKALASQVNGQSFGSLAQLQSVFTEVDTFVNQTLPSLTAQQTNIGSLAATLNSLSGTFQPAIDEGNKLGIGVDALTAAYAKQTQAANDAVATQVLSDAAGFQASYLAARAQVTGSATDQQTAALYSFDSITAVQDRQQLTQEYQGIFGDAYASTAQYVQSSVELEQALAEQRLAIQTQFNSQSTQAASQAAGASITSLLGYVQKLQGASTSPLSATDQYSLARSQFQDVSGAAVAGDYNSINNLPTYADALLSASRTVNGSGIGYANDYSSVLSSVTSVAGLGADTLTQAFMAAQLQSQTDTLNGTLTQILVAISGSQTALLQGAGAPPSVRIPSRIAA